MLRVDLNMSLLAIHINPTTLVRAMAGAQITSQIDLLTLPHILIRMMSVVFLTGREALVHPFKWAMLGVLMLRHIRIMPMEVINSAAMTTQGLDMGMFLVGMAMD